MEGLTIEAGTLRVARGLYNALSEFHPELSGDGGRHRVTVEVRSGDRRIVPLLDAIQAHVTARDNGPAHTDLDGYRYTFHAQER